MSTPFTKFTERRTEPRLVSRPVCLPSVSIRGTLSRNATTPSARSDRNKPTAGDGYSSAYAVLVLLLRRSPINLLRRQRKLRTKRDKERKKRKSKEKKRKERGEKKRRALKQRESVRARRIGVPRRERKKKRKKKEKNGQPPYFDNKTLIYGRSLRYNRRGLSETVPSRSSDRNYTGMISLPGSLCTKSRTTGKSRTAPPCRLSRKSTCPRLSCCRPWLRMDRSAG